jgi:hypothetical protein
LAKIAYSSFECRRKEPENPVPESFGLRATHAVSPQ